MNKYQGLSLTELLVSLFVASLLSAMLIQTYLINKQRYFALQDALKVNFELQWVEDMLADSIRRAGFTPCLGVEQLQVRDRRKGKLVFSGFKIEVKKQELLVNRMSEEFSELSAVLNYKQEILVSSETKMRVDQSILIADCERAELHQVTQRRKTAEGVLLTLAKPILFNYPTVTYVGQWLEERWYIKKNPEGQEALYYQQSHSEELTALIHTLKLKRQGNKLNILWDLENKKQHKFTVIVRT